MEKAPRRKLFWQKELIEAGCDEAGRGCLAGPVVAAAVILPSNFRIKQVNDSKMLTAEEREAAAKIIRKKAVSWAIAEIDHEEIDRINILKASIKAMHMAVDKMEVKPQFLVIDGNYFIPYPGLSHKCVVDGDALIASIGAASILAKTHRDALMDKLHEEYPVYGWITNKGYSTPHHKKMIREHGISHYHRRTYRPVDEHLQLELFEEMNLNNEALAAL